MSVQSLTDVELFPYYADIPLEVAPYLSRGEANYVRGAVNGLAYEGLQVPTGVPHRDLHAGAAYVAFGRNPQGEQVQPHWMYCTQVKPVPRFAISLNHCKPGVCAPAPYLDRSLSLTLEPLEEISRFAKL